MQSLCMGISTLLLSALFPFPSTGQFNVTGQEESVIALVGKEAVLSCHLSPVTDAQAMNVTWFRIDTADPVHHYAAGQDQLDQQQPKYRGRTEFLKDNITRGQVALRIRPIYPSDDGHYSCAFVSSTFKSEARFTVLVTVSGTAPQIHIETGSLGEIKLTCTSSDWYPEPHVQWRDLYGNVSKPISEKKTAEENGLFQVKTSIIIKKSLNVTCAISNPILREQKKASISLADSLFPEFWPWIVGPVIFMLCFWCVYSAIEYMIKRYCMKQETPAAR